MKKIFILTLFLAFISLQAQQQEVTYTINPQNFTANESITISIDGNSVDEDVWGITNHELYLWSWSYNLEDNSARDCPTNGSWDNSNEANRLTYNESTDTYSISFVPTEFYDRTYIGRIGFLVKAKDGSGDKKSQNIYAEVDGFEMTLVQPNEGSTIEINAGTSISIVAEANQNADWMVFAYDEIIYESSSASTSLNFNYTPTTSTSIAILATKENSNAGIYRHFEIILLPNNETLPIPAWAEPGINYHPTDNSRIVLALQAPYKEYVHVIGSFNDWQVNDDYLMHRDTNDNSLFWIELENLNPGEQYTFQYRTNGDIRVADPYSPLVLSPYDDQWIEEEDYPNLPDYPTDTNFEVSVFQTDQNDYDWNITNFEKPDRDDLIIYEILLRDFTTEKNYQSLIDKIPYLKSLNINAIELMPIMEFEGNNSWGYNPSFHYALDKAYGTQEKFKEFVDTAHENGIAVILDVALNHATGRNPLARLWNIDPDGDGYGPIASSNPYFNQNTRHAYGVFEDFDHSSDYTQYYVKRVIQHWIQEYKIDGFRWDLTKGFTQNCSDNDENCTNSYQQDRVDILKQYADYQWEIDDTSYVIFEHLGSAEEESEWANYRIDDGKGIMTWNNLNAPYNQNTMGYTENSNFNWIDHELHGFEEKTAVSYGGSHDEERLMFKNLAYGASNGNYNVQDLATSLNRQEAYGAMFLTVPGPKMIWQFDELGYEFGINRCEDGSYSNDCRTSPKPVAFDLGYANDPDRISVYDTWSHILNMRLANSVFDTETYSVSSGDLLPRIYLWDDNLPNSTLNKVIVIANFKTSLEVVTPEFPMTGTWYNLENNAAYNVISPNQSLTLNPGEYIIFGNQPAQRLNTNELVVEEITDFVVLNNPITDDILKFKHNSSSDGTLYMYDTQGTLVMVENFQATTSLVEIPLKVSPGIYHLIFETNKNHTSRKVLFK